ncbi:MAG: PEP/pyruvate-binding domain-containing protein [bacterium]
MQITKPFSQITKNDVSTYGGKGASLGELTNANISVPPGFVILAGVFDQFIMQTNLKEEIKARLNEVNIEDVNSIDKASNVLRDAIHDTSIPDEIIKSIKQAFLELDSEYVAVRSSATVEDGQVASWAGELETYLNTTEENLIDNVKKCWSSLFTPRAIFYRHEKNLIDHDVLVAVVVQKMIQSDVSGITFTVHPVTEDKDQMIIEAGFGLGEAIVSGQITPDNYIVDKTDMSIIDININAQNKKLIKTDTHSNKWIDLPDDEAKKQKLTGKQIIEVARVCKRIEEHYGFPCDIEWAVEKGNIYITQSRPITTLSDVN